MQTAQWPQAYLNPFRPIYVMCEEGVESDHLQAVLEATNAVLQVAGMQSTIQVHNFGTWRNAGWVENGHLTGWNSVDWYLSYAANEGGRSNQVHGGWVLNLLYSEPWQKQRPHYDIVVTKQDLFDDGCSFVIGLAVQKFGTVISTNRFLQLDRQTARECIITETMHEVGHVFGLVPDGRTEAVEESLGLHCTNRCIMRQGLRVPHDWLRITEDRLNGHGFCHLCRRDLKQYFR